MSPPVEHFLRSAYQYQFPKFPRKKLCSCLLSNGFAAVPTIACNSSFSRRSCRAAASYQYLKLSKCGSADIDSILYIYYSICMHCTLQHLDISPLPRGLVLPASKLSPIAPIKRKGACRKYRHKERRKNVSITVTPPTACCACKPKPRLENTSNLRDPASVA